MKLISKNHNGFTLTELMIVIAIIGVLVLISIPVFSNVVVSARLNTDKANVRILNGATNAYKVEYNLDSESVFDGTSDDDSKISKLIDNGYLMDMIVPQSVDGDIRWDQDTQVWFLIIENEVVMLTEFGNSFMDISNGFIGVIQEKFDENGKYGRTWGDYRFTDLDIDPEDWEDAISHFNFRPNGSELIVKPENGFKPTIETVTGEVKTVYTNYNVIYDLETEKWYWHSVAAENEVDINTLQLTP